jgi:hypothetical protein
MGLFDFFRKKNNQQTSPAGSSSEKLADQLKKLGYFKYADPADIETLSTEVAESLAVHHRLPFVGDDNLPYCSKDFRVYLMDNEELYQQDGIITMLGYMNAVFIKMKIRLEISSHIEETGEANKGLNHRITINGQPYILFDKFDGSGWSEAAQRFADIINDQLTRQQSEERLYLINGGNDGRAVFLTEDQQWLISDLIKDPAEKPLPVQEWCRTMSVERIRIKDSRLVGQFLEGLHQKLTKESLASLAFALGASPAELDRLKSRFPDCPESLLQLLSRINGTYHEQYGPHRVAVLMLGSDVFELPYYLKSVEQILEENSYGRSIRDIYEDNMEDMPELIEGPIDPDIKLDYWLSFSDCMNNGGTSSLYVDFNPAPGGTKGQIIRFLHDPDSFKVIARCFDEYLDSLIKDGYSYILPEE